MSNNRDLILRTTLDYMRLIRFVLANRQGSISIVEVCLKAHQSDIDFNQYYKNLSLCEIIREFELIRERHRKAFSNRPHEHLSISTICDNATKSLYRLIDYSHSDSKELINNRDIELYRFFSYASIINDYDCPHLVWKLIHCDEYYTKLSLHELIIELEIAKSNTIAKLPILQYVNYIEGIFDKAIGSLHDIQKNREKLKMYELEQRLEVLSKINDILN